MDARSITDFELYDIVAGGDKEEIESLKEVVLEGWVKTNRDNGSIGFIEFNDGTYFKNVQLVYHKECKDYELLSGLKTGAAIKVVGDVVLTPENKQPFDFFIKEFELEGDVEEDYPLQRRDILSNFFVTLHTYAHVQILSKPSLESAVSSQWQFTNSSKREDLSMSTLL